MGCRILVTGAGGTIGSALVEHLLEQGHSVVALDVSEAALGRLLPIEHSDRQLELRFHDVAERSKLIESASGCEWIIHCAALKRVDVGQRFASELALRNVAMYAAVLDAARIVGVSRLLLCSTDKAATPTSVMGASKLLLERMSVAATSEVMLCGAVRFANVLNSTGSLVPTAIRSMKDTSTIDLRDALMTRYMMSSDSAVKLIYQAISCMTHGDIFIPLVRSARIIDVVHALRALFCSKYGRIEQSIAIRATANTYHENVHERMITDCESERLTLDSSYAIIKSAAPSASINDAEGWIKRMRSSEVNTLNHNEVLSLLCSEVQWDLS